MACLKLFLCLFLLTLSFISCSSTRLFNSVSVSNPALTEYTKTQNQSPTSVKLETPEKRHVGFRRLGKLTLAVEVKDMSQTSKASERNHESNRFVGGSSSKRALIDEGREAIKASIQRNGGNPFESKRLSPGGPDPHHH